MLTPLYRQQNAGSAAIFPVKRRQRLYNERKSPLTPLLVRSTPLTPVLFRFNAVKTAIFPVKRC